MSIISISLDDELLREIEKLQKELGFSGRSEVVRAGAKMLIADCKEKERLEGSLNSVLLLIHTQNVEDTVTEIKHEFEDIISTQIHNHLRKDKCLEVFILEGDAARVKELVRMLQTCGKMDFVKLIVA
ncbi:MAG: CopG family ribbon-helix-helix protein [archaeon]|nr:CopG family ribbon-helix-helix protein [archaeon]